MIDDSLRCVDKNDKRVIVTTAISSCDIMT